MKKVYVKLLVLAPAIFVLVLGLAFAACGDGNIDEQWTPDPKTPEMISADTLADMKIAHMEYLGVSYVDAFYLAEYCGSYGGSVASVMKKFSVYPAAEGSETVAGVTFSYNDESRITVWRDGVVYTLQEAYDGGAITLNDLKNIAYYHEHPWQPDPLAPLTDETVAQIKNAYLKKRGKSFTLEDVIIAQYCGIYGGCPVIMINMRSDGFMTAIYDECIAGVEFYFPNFNERLYAFKNDEFYELIHAYEDGFFSVNDMKNIGYYHATEDMNRFVGVID